MRGTHTSFYVAAVVASVLLLSQFTPAQQTPSPPGAPPTQPAPPRGRGPGGGTPPGPDDAAGFVSLFDGLSLKGWDGDPTFWRVQDGVIVAESTPEKVVTDNTFLIWRGGM